MWECPNCHEDIRELLYSAPQTEYGSAYLDDNDRGPGMPRVVEHDSSDTDSNGPVRYECPLCEEEIDTVLLIYKGPRNRESSGRSFEEIMAQRNSVEDTISIEGPMTSKTKKERSVAEFTVPRMRIEPEAVRDLYDSVFGRTSPGNSGN